MVVKSFSATSLQMLDDLVNSFIKAKDEEWREKEDVPFKYTVTYHIVPAHNFTVTDDHSGVRREVFAKEYFIAVIQY